MIAKRYYFKCTEENCLKGAGYSGYEQVERKWTKTCIRLADLSKLFGMVKLFNISFNNHWCRMVVCGHLGGWNQYIFLSWYSIFPFAFFSPSPFPSPFCPCHASNLSCVSERAPNTQYFGSRQKALRTKSLTIQRNNRWPNPKNNRWVSKERFLSEISVRLQSISRVRGRSRRVFCVRKKTLTLQTTSPTLRIMSSGACKLQRLRGRET